jgi:hydrogenase maturation protease
MAKAIPIALEPEPVTVIGLGSPFGDDRAGWRVAELLEDRIPASCARILRLDRPGPALLDEIAGGAEAILVDAGITGQRPGKIHRFAVADFIATPLARSSHAVGLADTLTLGKALGILPSVLRLYLVSIDADEADRPEGALTPPVEAAVRSLACEIAHYLTSKPIRQL